jgi:hypothetical protein
MQTSKRILAVWLVCLAVGAGLLLVLSPGSSLKTGALVTISVRLLIGIVCSFILFREPSQSRKPIFLNFSLYFLNSILWFLYAFVGRGATLFSANDFAAFYTQQYLYALDFFLLAFAVIYVVLDSLFSNFKIYQKYIFTLLIVGGTFTYYYSPFFENPKYLYTTEDISDYKAVRNSVEQLVAEGKDGPTVTEISAITQLGVWRDGKQIGLLLEGEKARRIAEILPYLEGLNYTVLLWKPLYLNTIYMSVLCVVFIFLFFGYQYKNDPPQGAYIEKIVFLFLPYCSLEILHHYGYIKSVQATAMWEISQIGYYLSLVNLVAFLVFFGLRLRFISSVKGEFYERELVSDSEHISRWRDAFDNLIVRHFLNPQALHGRLFAPRTPRTETEPAAKNNS